MALEDDPPPFRERRKTTVDPWQFIRQNDDMNKMNECKQNDLQSQYKPSDYTHDYRV